MTKAISVPFAGLLLALLVPNATAQKRAELIYVDRAGVLRWRNGNHEVALFGANYVLTTASDYRAAGYLHADRKLMIDEDMAQFARMGWDGLRLTFWGDWEASDSAGNLIANDHLDLLDYLIARAAERGIYMLLSPIQLYSSNWPDALSDTTQPGFGRRFGKGRMGTDSAALRAQVNYLRQILNHVNPYTHRAIKDEPDILFIELVNEPWHHPEDMAGSIHYINTLTDAVRSTGCQKLVFYNVSQDFRIGEAIRRSNAQGVTFGWYPTGLNAGHELEGNYLRGADVYPDMRRPELAKLPRIVYEFDSPDLRTGTMYPAMARTFRSVGTQFAAMFAYDMLETASRNLGWQTHALNMVYTARKAMSAVIAAEAMRRLPRMQDYGPYPRNTRFGDFHLSYDGDLGELVARDAFMYTSPTQSTPPEPRALERVYGHGSSPLVTYGGTGIYFLDKIRAGVWRLELYPDAVPIRDPFELPSADKIVTRAIVRARPMTIALPDLGPTFTAQPVAAGNAAPTRATAGKVVVTPGVYVLSADPVDVASLPVTVNRVGLKEYHAPPRDTVPLTILSFAAPQYVAGQDAEIRARVVDTLPPDSVVLFVRQTPGGFFRGFTMRPGTGYDYVASLPAGFSRPGPYEFVITAFRGDSSVTFPGATRPKPTDWNYNRATAWQFDVVTPDTPLRLFDPGTDAARLAFSRIGDAGRRGLFRVGFSSAGGEPVFHFELPTDSSGWSPEDYTASLVVKARVLARGGTIDAARELRVRLRGLSAPETVHLTLMEDDGTSWATALTVDSGWSDQVIPLDRFATGRGVLLPEGFPGEWNYWVGPAEGRGTSGDHLRPEHLERLQISLRRGGGKGVEVESIVVGFAAQQPAVKATLRVRVPDSTGTVYLAGSLPELGPWRPDGRALTGTGRDRTIDVTAPAGTTLEYKFTLGTWDREALNATGAVPPNSRLLFTRDTVVAVELAGFKKDIRDYIADWRGSGVLGRLVYWPPMHSAHLGPDRVVEIWLPPGYDSSSTTRYPVLYMSDGQNLFDPRIASTGTDWGVDEAIVRLVQRGVIPPVIVVGVWNSAERGKEYSPWQNAPDYARFLIEELMPRVNAQFRTLTGAAHTAVMGSSMGGLLSFYLVTHHPEAFGACGCMSTAFLLSPAFVQQYFTGVPKVANPDTTAYIERDIQAGLRAPRGARYWFDFGGQGLDTNFGPSHEIVRQWLRKQGLKDGVDFVIRRYPDATHNEASWRARLDDPLTFLFGRRP
ncbi:MAG TPA: alpha/beta hydrolase-fold protein [Gemmatimonadales bacterium]|nr:alpha/beta hydrolase-fold protein [Gemmatimonadales bacterium]